MNLDIYLLNPKYCTGCPYSEGICGCGKYLNEDGSNKNCGLDGLANEPKRLKECIEENGI